MRSFLYLISPYTITKLVTGLSGAVLEHKDDHIQSELEKHSPNNEKYALVAKVVHVGTALLVYARDQGLARRVTDVQTQWTGCGLNRHMGNKGAVGIRFRVPSKDGGIGETFTFVLRIYLMVVMLNSITFSFVCAHLTPHAHKLNNRIRDWNHIVESLSFPPLPASSSTQPSTLYETSHLFVLGDFNFRVVLPRDHPHAGVHEQGEFNTLLESQAAREDVKDHDQLLQEWRKGTTFVGLREGDFWNFKCSYKYLLGKVDIYALVFSINITQLVH